MKKRVAKTASCGGPLQAMPLGAVQLKGGHFERRYRLNRNHVLSLGNENLLQNHYLEAGLWPHVHNAKPSDDIHWGWEAPTCQVRGHFLGHWLSAAAWKVAATGDAEIKAKADAIIEGLGRCQKANGGQWCFSIPEKYLHWLAEGRSTWAPQYVIHKTLMGLLDMAALAGNGQALQIAENAAAWFVRWIGTMPSNRMQDIMEFSETGGMMEGWADLYGLTHKQEHLDLMLCYERRRLFDRLLAGEDALSNQHANSTIPEAHGAARAHEVTGERRFRDIAEAYWGCAVDRREAYCTGSANNGEFWIAPGQLPVNFGPSMQEHCTVFNMMRLADFLFRWSGEARYADYYERNLVNGILAQQNPSTGMVAYDLPLEAGAVKKWGTPTNHFWCCQGTLVQAQTRYATAAFFGDEEGLVVSQYIPGELAWNRGGQPIKLTLGNTNTKTTGFAWNAADTAGFQLTVDCGQPVEFTLKLRLPWWLAAAPVITVNGQPETTAHRPSTFLALHRVWRRDDTVDIALPKKLVACPLPGQPELMAFMEGPTVLAGLVDRERLLQGEPNRPESMLLPDDTRAFRPWKRGYRTRGQDNGFRFIPLFDVKDEPYTVYFTVDDTTDARANRSSR